jgi:hypothetical protein
MRLLSFVLLACALHGGEARLPLQRLTLEESPAYVAKRLAISPAVIKGQGHQVYQFQPVHPGHEEHADTCNRPVEWEFYFDTRLGRFESATFNPETPLPVQSYFPKGKHRVVSMNSAGLRVTMLVRELPNGRLLIAGAPPDGRATLDQVILMRRESVARFLPALAAELAAAPAR